MSELWTIAQRHLDAYGVRAAALARRMGTSPQTLDSWKNRGLRQLPERRLLEALARETRTPYGEVLQAALRDIDYLPRESDGHGNAAPMTSAGSAPAVPSAPSSAMDAAVFVAAFEQYVRDADAARRARGSAEEREARLAEVRQHFVTRITRTFDRARPDSSENAG